MAGPVVTLRADRPRAAGDGRHLRGLSRPAAGRYRRLSPRRGRGSAEDIDFQGRPGLSNEIKAKLDRAPARPWGRRRGSKASTPAALTLLGGSCPQAPVARARNPVAVMTKSVVMTASDPAMFHVKHSKAGAAGARASPLAGDQKPRRAGDPDPDLGPGTSSIRCSFSTLRPRPRRWLDLGSGGGFPGLVLAIAGAEPGGSTSISSKATRANAPFLGQIVRDSTGAASVHRGARSGDPRSGLRRQGGCGLGPWRSRLWTCSWTGPRPCLKAGTMGLFPQGAGRPRLN